MTNVIPVKIIYDPSGSPSGIGEFTSTDSVGITNGGTGSNTATGAKTTLGFVDLTTAEILYNKTLVSGVIDSYTLNSNCILPIGYVYTSGSPTNGQVLVYSPVGWTPSTLNLSSAGGSGGNASAIGGYSLSSPFSATTGQSLVFSGGFWIASTITGGSFSGGASLGSAIVSAYNSGSSTGYTVLGPFSAINYTNSSLVFKNLMYSSTNDSPGNNITLSSVGGAILIATTRDLYADNLKAFTSIKTNLITNRDLTATDILILQPPVNFQGSGFEVAAPTAFFDNSIQVGGGINAASLIITGAAEFDTDVSAVNGTTTTKYLTVLTSASLPSGFLFTSGNPGNNQIIVYTSSGWIPSGITYPADIDTLQNTYAGGNSINVTEGTPVIIKEVSGTGFTDKSNFILQVQNKGGTNLVGFTVTSIVVSSILNSNKDITILTSSLSSLFGDLRWTNSRNASSIGGISLSSTFSGIDGQTIIYSGGFFILSTMPSTSAISSSATLDSAYHAGASATIAVANPFTLSADSTYTANSQEIFKVVSPSSFTNVNVPDLVVYTGGVTKLAAGASSYTFQAGRMLMIADTSSIKLQDSGLNQNFYLLKQTSSGDSYLQIKNGQQLSIGISSGSGKTLEQQTLSQLIGFNLTSSNLIVNNLPVTVSGGALGYTILTVSGDEVVGGNFTIKNNINASGSIFTPNNVSASQFIAASAINLGSLSGSYISSLDSSTIALYNRKYGDMMSNLNIIRTQKYGIQKPLSIQGFGGGGVLPFLITLGTAASYQSVGCVLPTTTGTIAAAGITAVTSKIASLIGLNNTGTAALNSATGYVVATPAQWLWRRTDTSPEGGDLGGFFFEEIFGQTTNTSGAQAFMGLAAATTLVALSAAGNEYPSKRKNLIGMGYDFSSTTASNWQLFCASGTAQSGIDLGSNAVRDTSSIFRLRLFSPPQGSSIFVSIEKMNTHPPVLIYSSELSTNIPGGQGASNTIRPNCSIGTGTATTPAQVWKHFRGYGETYI